MGNDDLCGGAATDTIYAGKAGDDEYGAAPETTSSSAAQGTDLCRSGSLDGCEI